jgi:hypothetical protein
MTDEQKPLDPFRPQEPTIPGVTGNPARAKSAPVPPRPLSSGYGLSPKPDLLSDPRILLAAGTAAVLLLLAVGLFFWYTHSTSAKSSNPQAEVVAPLTDLPPVPAKSASQPSKSWPQGPGPVATTAELSKVWSARRFTFRAPETADDVPALVVHLPGNVYWGLSLREPFGTCEMQYVEDLAQIENQYHYTASHPMVVDPCNHAVYDLEKYGPGPNGVVRGAIVYGAGVRPPLAIEMKVKGKQIVAVRGEQ